MRLRPAFACLCLVPALLSACAGLGRDGMGGDMQPAPGLKRAWIAEFIAASTPPDKLPACLAKLPGSELQGKQYVRLRYRHVKKAINEVAELPPGMDASLDDTVEVEPHDCDKGELTRITRKLRRQAF